MGMTLQYSRWYPMHLQGIREQLTVLTDELRAPQRDAADDGGGCERLSRSARREVERDFPVFLLSLASALRTGLDPLAALGCTRDILLPQSALRKLLELLLSELDRGAGEELALRAFVKRSAHPDAELFAAAFLISRRMGGSLGDCLERLAIVCRQRQSFQRKSRAALALQRLSAFGIGGCASLIVAFQLLTNSEAVLGAARSTPGVMAYAAGVSLVVMGMIWLTRLGPRGV